MTTATFQRVVAEHKMQIAELCFDLESGNQLEYLPVQHKSHSLYRPGRPALWMRHHDHSYKY